MTEFCGIVSQTGTGHLIALLLFYAGPDQILPIVSVLGTIVGILLIWWHRFVGLIKKAWRSCFGKSESAAHASTGAEK